MTRFNKPSKHLIDQQDLSIDDLSIQQLLPHREPILLLERLLYCDDETCRVALTINQKSAFYNQELAAVPAWVGIEYMAQAIAVWSGYQQLKKGQPILIGFLLGSRCYRCEQSLFSENQCLEVVTAVRYVDETGLASFDCRIEDSAGTLLASAAINAFRPDNPEQFVAQVRQN